MGRSNVKVLFVCLGNICRSPLAEGIFKKKVVERGLESHFIIDSCGTSNYHIGGQPDRRTYKNALKNGLELSHQGRQFIVQDFYDFDYIVAMDSSNAENIERIRPKGCGIKVQLMRSFDGEALTQEVPDPYYGGESGFQDVYDILEVATEGLLREIIEDYKIRI